jgi:hypothetical protein
MVIVVGEGPVKVEQLEQGEQAPNSAEGVNEDKAQAVSIPHQIYSSFADLLAADPAHAAVAERLRKTLITDGARSEAVLRAALFEGDAA